MNTVPQPARARADLRSRDAWTVFWQEPGQARCVAGAADVWQVLDEYWSAFSRSLPASSRVLDLGCGAGAVARRVAAARPDVSVTGIDFARIPLTLRPQVELLSETAMERLPFEDASFGAAVSQFGFEYSDTARAALELARVLAPGATIQLLVHHAESGIVSSNADRLLALQSFLGPAVRNAFCEGDARALEVQLSSLAHRHPADALVAELRRSLPSRVGRPPRERAAIWTAIEDALAPERCLAESLSSSCVAPAGLDRWLQPLRAGFELAAPIVLREPAGLAIGWHIRGCRKLY